MAPISDDPVKRLNRLDVCAVSDAMDKLGLRGGVSGLRQRSGTRRIAGRVLTVRLVAKDRHASAGAGGAVRHLGTTAIENARRGDIIVVEQRSGIEAGSWGGILSLAAKLRGVAGVICEGPVRDIDEARQHDFAVFARGLTARSARGRIVEAANNGPVTIGDVAVEAGDFAIADASGVVFVRAGDIEPVLAAAESIAAREAAMAKALLEGQPVSQVMGANYEQMLAGVRS